MSHSSMALSCPESSRTNGAGLYTALVPACVLADTKQQPDGLSPLDSMVIYSNVLRFSVM
jgi:hypothetical protein